MTDSSGKVSLTFLDEILTGGKKWILKEENLSHIRSCFSSLPTPGHVPEEVQEKVFLALASCLEVEPNLWRFAQHFLVPGYPPFQRFVGKFEPNLEPPPVKRTKSGTKRKSFYHGVTKRGLSLELSPPIAQLHPPKNSRA